MPSLLSSATHSSVSGVVLNGDDCDAAANNALLNGRCKQRKEQAKSSLGHAATLLFPPPPAPLSAAATLLFRRSPATPSSPRHGCATSSTEHAGENHAASSSLRRSPRRLLHPNSAAATASPVPEPTRAAPSSAPAPFNAARALHLTSSTPRSSPPPGTPSSTSPPRHRRTASTRRPRRRALRRACHRPRRRAQPRRPGAPARRLLRSPPPAPRARVAGQHLLISLAGPRRPPLCLTGALSSTPSRSSPPLHSRLAAGKTKRLSSGKEAPAPVPLRRPQLAPPQLAFIVLQTR